MGHGERMFVLFAGQDADALKYAERVEQDFVGIDVELLLHLALHVDLAVRTQNVGQAGAADFGLNHFGGQRDAGLNERKLAAGTGKALLIEQDVLLERHQRRRSIAKKGFALEGRRTRIRRRVHGLLPQALGSRISR